jgi:hypothetical protein
MSVPGRSGAEAQELCREVVEGEGNSLLAFHRTVVLAVVAVTANVVLSADISFNLQECYCFRQGDRICDVCKAQISNLPEVAPPVPATEAGSEAGNSIFDDVDERNHPHGLHGAFVADQMPGSADIVFDCIRVSSTC